MAKPIGKKRKDRPVLASALVAVAAFVMLFSLTAIGVAPERYDIRVGEVYKADITASKAIEDTFTTERLRQAARDAVSPSYTPDQSVTPSVMSALTAAAAKVDRLPKLLESEDGVASGASAMMIAQARSDLEPARLDDEQLRVLIEADEPMLSQLSTEVLLRVRDTLVGGLLEGQEDDAIQKLKRDLSGEGFPDPLIRAYVVIVQAHLRPNMILDEEATQANRDKAAAAVEPVMYQMGQNIVRRGEPVTSAQIEVLNALGMLKDRRIDITLYAGVAMLLLLLGLVIWSYLYAFESEMLRKPSRLLLLALIMALVVALSLLVRPLSSYLMPVSLGAMLVALLFKSRLAIVTNMVLSVITGLMASVDTGLFTVTMYSIMLTSFISGSVCASVIRNSRQWSSVLVSGLIVGVINMVSTVAVSLINSANFSNVLNWAFWSAGSGLLSSMLCIGLQLVLAWVFNIDTNSKLIELSNPNQPLLRRLMIEAPGTYHHSMIVANLSEAAANTVGVNALLARVGAYYHDIGKLKRPMYFKENQLNDNPHDRTDPRVSTAILTAHPRDGVEMAQKARLPLAVQEIILQHHGDTPVLFFYDKAVKQGGDVDIQDFRYDGPRPQRAEAAIVMLADTIEAAVRAMTDVTPDSLSQLIQRLIRSKLEDGQLDRCNLTFRDLNRVSEAFLQVLGGVYHERIEYPEVNIPGRKRLDESVMEQPVPGEEPVGQETPGPSTSVAPDRQAAGDEA